MPKASAHFWWLPTTLSIALSALGILALAQHAFVEWSLSKPVALVMASYHATMQLLFGWAHPYLQAALTWLGTFIGWRPTLYPHWRDVFVVVGLIGSGAGRGRWREHVVRNSLLTPLGRFGNSFVLAIGPILGAIIAALAAGMLPLQSPDLITQLLIAASLGLGALLTFFGWGVEETGEVRDALLVSPIVALVAGALAALATWLLSLALGNAVGLGLAGIAIVVVLFGLLLVLDSIAPTETGELVWGLTILGGFVGAAFVAAVDAGLRLLGA